MECYYINRKGKSLGPFSKTQLRMMGRNGKILKSDLVRKGNGPWLNVARVKGLLEIHNPNKNINSKVCDDLDVIDEPGQEVEQENARGLPVVGLTNLSVIAKRNLPIFALIVCLSAVGLGCLLVFNYPSAGGNNPRGDQFTKIQLLLNARPSGVKVEEPKPASQPNGLVTATQEPNGTSGSDSLLGDTNAIKTLTVKQATDLAKHKVGGLALNGLTTLSPDVATELAKLKSEVLTLKGLTTLSPEVATELAKFKGFILDLRGLTTVAVEVATELAKLKGENLWLDGLTTVSVEVATELAKFKGNLHLDGLTTLSPEVATELAKLKGTLILNGLTTLPIEVAKELAKSKGSLNLNGLRTLPIEVATELAKHKGSLGLSGLTTLSPDVATELANHKGELLLNGLETVSRKTLGILKANPMIRYSQSVRFSEPENTPEGKDSGQ